MQESKVFKVFLGYRRDTNSRFSNTMIFIQSDTAEAASKLAKKLTIALNPGIKEIKVNNCFEQTGDENKKVPANKLLTKENFNQWVKITSEPAKGILKMFTTPSWLKKKPAVKSVTSIPAPGTSKPLTNPAWLTKKPVEKSATSTPAPGASKQLTNPAWLTKKPVEK